MSLVSASLNSSVFAILNCSLEDNRSDLDGGAFMLLALQTNDSATMTWKNSQVSIRQCKFLRNTANRGGALNVVVSVVNMTDNRSVISVRDSYFYLNEASQDGGAIKVLGSRTEAESNLLVANSTFLTNRAVIQGGGLYALGTVRAQIDSNSFVNCSAEVASSALGITGLASGDGTVIFSGNNTIVSPAESLSLSRVQGQQLFIQGVGSIEVDRQVTKIVCLGGPLSAKFANASLLQPAFEPAASYIGFETTETFFPLQLWVAHCGMCAAHTYALNDVHCSGESDDEGNTFSDDVCLPCPDGASCLGGTSVTSENE